MDKLIDVPGKGGNVGKVSSSFRRPCEEKPVEELTLKLFKLG